MHNGVTVLWVRLGVKGIDLVQLSFTQVGWLTHWLAQYVAANESTSTITKHNKSLFHVPLVNTAMTFLLDGYDHPHDRMLRSAAHGDDAAVSPVSFEVLPALP